MNLQKRDQKDRIRYKLLQIPKTRFKILYQDVQFDMSRFLQLIGITWAKGNKYIILDSEQAEWIFNSCQYDKKEIQFYQCKNILQYLSQCYKSPQLNQVYQLLQPEDKFSQIQINLLKPMEYFNYIKKIHPKTNSPYSNEQELQALVSYFYNKKLPFYMGYVFYMFYDRLNLYSEYNGIIGRLIFVENGKYPIHFPISIFLKDTYCPYVNDICDLFNVPQKSFSIFSKFNSNFLSDLDQLKYRIISSNSKNNDKYFSIKLSKKDIQKIIMILAFSILYYQHQNDDQLTKQLLIKYFQDPFEDDPYYDDIEIKNFKEIREMINQLNWDQEDTQDTIN